MDVIEHRSAAPTGDRTRLPGPDVVRAVALIGVVVMNYHGYLVIAGAPRGDGWWDELFDPWEGPLSTRFAATFVVTAGVGVTLLTRSATTPALVRARRWTLLRRGLVLFVLGWWIYEVHWAGSILPYYGALFALAALMFTWRSWVLGIVGTAAAVAGAGLAWWRLERQLDGRSTDWLFDPDRWTPRGLILDTVVNGTHPLLPWLTFFCAGIVLGRVLATAWWRPLTIAAGMTMYAMATIVSTSAGTGRRAVELTSVHNADRALTYTASALGTALVAFAVISWIADRWPTNPLIEALRHAGAMTLTLYLLHIVVYKLVVDHLGWVEPNGLGTALTFAAIFWVVAIAAAAGYHGRFGIGPAEWVYRKLGG
ncbi:MAG: DUF418 domain-containing protein [Desertimonas sp.]